MKLRLRCGLVDSTTGTFRIPAAFAEHYAAFRMIVLTGRGTRKHHGLEVHGYQCAVLIGQ
jgi:hypothetical protein